MIPEECKTHCWMRMRDSTADHAGCDGCCYCGVKFIDLYKDNTIVTPELEENRKLALLIGNLILHCGNIYNENKQDITVNVAKFILNKIT